MKVEGKMGDSVADAREKAIQKQSNTGERQEEQRETRRFRVRMILFGILILHYFFFPRIFPSHDMMGQEGLKRIIVQGIAILPAMFCLAVTVLAEGILWFLRKRQRIAEFNKWMVWSWVFLLCVNGWWCGMETRNLLHAVQDWKLMAEAESGQDSLDLPDRKGIDQVSFRSWRIQKTSTMGVTRGYYLKNAARTFSFPLGKELKRRQSIESFADQELTVYYYHYSHVPVRICAGEQILAGE